jgi:hypothetical protein
MSLDRPWAALSRLDGWPGARGIGGQSIRYQNIRCQPIRQD